MKELDDRQMRRLAREISHGETASGFLPALEGDARRAAVDAIVARADSLDEEFQVTQLCGRVSRSSFAVSKLIPLAAAAALALAVAGIAYHRFAAKTPAIEVAPRAMAVLSPTEERVAAKEGPLSGTLSLGVRALFESGSEARIEKTEDTLRVILARGAVWLHVDPLENTRRVSVRTDEGDVVVKGTVFRVETAFGETTVRVLRGAVALVPKKGARCEVAAGESGALGTATTTPMAELEMREDRAKLAAFGVAGPLDLPLTLGPEPSMTATSGTREEPNRGIPKAGIIAVEATSLRGATAESLLSAIREERAARNWRNVAALYETLILEHGGSEAANAAIISLGQVHLEKLAAPAEALRLFDGYLASGKRALAPEALQGKAIALRALGRECQERRALEMYVGAFPKAVFANKAAERLDALSSAGFDPAACPDSEVAGTR